jgi:large subunit ribosomal protein L23
MSIVKSPVITEKALNAYKKDKKVTFSVDLNATKDQVKRIVEQVYGVKVLEVKSITRLGKKSYNRISKRMSKKADKKLMILRLNKSSKIEDFEGK